MMHTDLVKLELRDAAIIAYNAKLCELLNLGEITQAQFDQFDRANINIVLRAPSA